MIKKILRNLFSKKRKKYQMKRRSLLKDEEPDPEKQRQIDLWADEDYDEEEKVPTVDEVILPQKKLPEDSSRT